jgi:[ribosomal protein S5]-alanine N-acetyltransferase
VFRLFDRLTARVPGPKLADEALLLRLPEMRDYESYARIREQSRSFLEPWEPIWPEDDLTQAAFQRRVTRAKEDMARDQAYSFLIFHRGDDTLLGGINLVSIRRGAAATAGLGYWMGASHAGRGVMGKAVRLVVDHAFSSLALQRVEAACLSENERSRRLLVSAGFRQEGVARAFLEIAGKRRDHLLFARLAADSVPADARHLPASKGWRV